MTDDRLNAIRDIIQRDVGRRGLATDPACNLLTECTGDFAAACKSLANTSDAGVAVVTGFLIPTAQPPAGETDGPLGAVYLARALTPLGIRVAILTDAFCWSALNVGIEACGLGKSVPVLTLPAPDRPWETFIGKGWLPFVQTNFRVSHLIALERVGPSHTPESVQRQSGAGETLLEFLHDVPPQHHDRCHTMRGIDITESMSPAHLLFESVQGIRGVTTIGIGDGGNEIGMGKMPWNVIRRNIPGGATVACRIATDHLIVAGISNWGAYGLAAGVWHSRGMPLPSALRDIEQERALLRIMVERGPLVDGMSGQRIVAVDGLAFEQYVEPLYRLQFRDSTKQA